MIVIHSLTLLQQNKLNWFQAILLNVHDEQSKWDEALFAAQKSIASEHESFLECVFSQIVERSL